MDYFAIICIWASCFYVGYKAFVEMNGPLITKKKRSIPNNDG